MGPCWVYEGPPWILLFSGSWLQQGRSLPDLNPMGSARIPGRCFMLVIVQVVKAVVLKYRRGPMILQRVVLPYTMDPMTL